MKIKLSNITYSLMANHPVWEIIDEAYPLKGGPFFKPVEDLPVSNLRGRVVFTQAALQNGSSLWCMLGNVHLKNRRCTEQFLTISVKKNNAWFHLSRYFETTYGRFGPEQLASFIGSDVNMIFPIKYDISGFTVGMPEVRAGVILAEPREKLSDEERMSLVFEGLKKYDP